MFLGIECSTYVFINSGTARWSTIVPMGDTTKRSVFQANKFSSRPTTKTCMFDVDYSAVSPVIMKFMEAPSNTYTSTSLHALYPHIMRVATCVLLSLRLALQIDSSSPALTHDAVRVGD